MKAIADFFVVGGFWMWPIFFAQMASLAIIGERIWKLYFTRTPDLRNMTARFEGELKRGHLDQAMNLAKNFLKILRFAKLLKPVYKPFQTWVDVKRFKLVLMKC